MQRYLQRVDSQVAMGLAFALLLGTQAGAQTAFNARSDILGIHLGDGIDAVKKTIADQFPGSSSFEVKDTLSAPEHKEEFTIGTLFDITSEPDKFVNEQRAAEDKQELDARAKAGLATGTPLDQRVSSTGDHGRERVAVTWYSGGHGSSNVFGIGRVKEFLAADRPLASATVAALIAKYGPPLQESKADRYNPNQFMFWASLNGVDRSKCLKGEAYPLLYESAGLYHIEPFERDAMDLQNFFLGQVNNIHQNNPLTDRSKCGIVLRAHLALSPDLQYVTQFSVNMADLTGGQGVLRMLGNGFFAEIDKVKNEKQQTAGQKTPKM